MSFDVYMEFYDIFKWRVPWKCHLTCSWNLMTFSRDGPLEHVIWHFNWKNAIYTSNYMFLGPVTGKCNSIPRARQMTCFFRAYHGKMPLNAIYTSNDLFFRVVSQENVLKSHVQVKLHVCLGACHGKMPYIHQITCLFKSVSRENAVFTSNFMLLVRVTEKCHIYTPNYMFLGACHGKMSFNAIYIYIKLHVCFGACHRKMSLNSMYTSTDVYMEVNDISLDTPLKSWHLTCTCYLMAFSGDSPRKIYLWTCTWNLMIFSPDAHLKTSFDVYMEFNDIFPWHALKHVIWCLNVV